MEQPNVLSNKELQEAINIIFTTNLGGYTRSTVVDLCEKQLEALFKEQRNRLRGKRNEN